MSRHMHPDLVSTPLLLEDMPILYEDEEEGDMGDAPFHTDTNEILHICLKAHFADRQGFRVYCNMNLYYQDEPLHEKTGSPPYVSPDIMVVEPLDPLAEDPISFKIGVNGPAPLVTVEALSQRSYQQRDLGAKLVLYAKLGVAEYILIDVTGRFLKERLLLKRLQPDGTWLDVIDEDGGVTSLLGFRIIIDEDGWPSVFDAATGRRYPRPDEADREAQARRQAEQQAKAEALSRRQAEQQAKAEALSRRQAEQQAKAESLSRQQAEEQARQAQEQVRRLQEELDQLTKNKRRGQESGE